MSRPVFEVSDYDAAGRRGELTVPRADTTVDTPALLPVINPHLQLVSAGRMAADFGAQIVITNAYVFHQSATHRDRVLEDGLHEVLEFPGAIMTDSGSFQLAEYGEIEVDTPEILAFQDAIGSDIATPVDVPTPPDADRTRAERDLEETMAAIETAAAFDAGDMLLSAPIQGATFSTLRERAAREVYAQELDVFPVGAVVPLLNEYRFAETVDVIAAAKRGLGEDAPVHLFGAGHPMMFALAVAMGCDLFDSAAYALYARDGRYLTVRGTVDVGELSELPCACPVCTQRSAEELQATPAREQETLLAEHNLHVCFAEMRRIRAAIESGELLELVEARARAHPTLLDGYRALLEHAAQLDCTDPASSRRPFFYVSAESAGRPAVERHHQRLERLSPPPSLLLADTRLFDSLPDEAPWEWDEEHDLPDGVVSTENFEGCWLVQGPFGPVPPALSHTYPATAELPARLDAAAYTRGVEGINRLAEGTSTSITFLHPGWPGDALDELAEGVVARTVGSNESASSPRGPEPEQ